MTIERYERADLPREMERAVQALLDQAFNSGADYYGADQPEHILVMTDHGRLIGHLAAWLRTVGLGDEDLAIGLIGWVGVDEQFRRQGHAKQLVQAAHRLFVERALPFSVLFAFDPPRYVSSGYRLMTNPTRFLDADGQWKQLVYRGGMVTELGARPWPGTLLDLRGRVV